ncbi:MAG: hypothetical protein ABI859_16450, partial [Pseudomonadota bacterium]
MVSGSTQISRAPAKALRRYNTFYGAALSWVACIGSHVSAATPSNDDGGLAEVVVTAQFRSENLQETPL